MSERALRRWALLAALLLLVAHQLLPGLHRYYHAEHDAAPACSDCASHPDGGGGRGDLPQIGHCHDHHGDCALCTMLLAQRQVLPSGAAVSVRYDARSVRREHIEVAVVAGERSLPPPARAPPVA